MNLAFSTILNNKPTYFVEKILKSIGTYYFKHQNCYVDLEEYFDKYTIQDNVLKCYLEPKIHTIRRDEKDRWKRDNKIHFVINPRTKDRVQFAPIMFVKSIQTIEIVYYTDREVLINDLPSKRAIVIDDKKRLTDDQILKIAINDGFDNVEDFFNYFNDDFLGKIIHWTDFQY